MRFRAQILAGALGLAGACSAEPVLIPLGIPPDPDAKSEILAVELEDDILLRTFDIESLTEPITIDIPLGGTPVRVEAALYHRPLQDLDLVARNETIKPGAGNLPPKPDSVFEAIPEGGLGWQPRLQPTAGFRIAQVGLRCPNADVSTMDANDQMRIIYKLSDTSALLAQNSLQRVDVSASGFTYRTVSQLPDTLQIRQILAGEDHPLLLLDAYGRAYAAELTGELELTRLGQLTSPTLDHDDYIDGGFADGDLEMVASRADRIDGMNATTYMAWYFRRGQWVALEDKVFDTVVTEHSVTWAGPGEAYFNYEATSELLRLKDGTAQWLDGPSTAPISRVNYIEGVGLVVLDTEGRAHVKNDGVWTTYESGDHFIGFASNAFRDGFMWGGPFGNLHLVHEGLQCALRLPHNVDNVIELDRNTVVAEGPRAGTREMRLVSLIRFE